MFESIGRERLTSAHDARSPPATAARQPAAPPRIDEFEARPRWHRSPNLQPPARTTVTDRTVEVAPTPSGADRSRYRASRPTTCASCAPAARPALTARQRAILDVIRDSVERRGYPPSIREICEAAGLASTSSVAHQLTVLERKGYLRRDPNRPRAVDVRGADERGRRGRRAGRRRGRRPTRELPPMPSPVYVPMVGRIAAGGPILAEQLVEEVFPLPKELVGDGTLFMLRVVGDSMVDAAISDGDWVVVRQQATAENGEIVAAMIDGEAT